jgi:hypothetical protein
MDVVVRLDACVHHEYRPHGVVLVRPRDQRIWSRNLGVIRYGGLLIVHEKPHDDPRLKTAFKAESARSVTADVLAGGEPAVCLS